MKPESLLAIVTISLAAVVGCGAGGDRAASSREALSAAECAAATPWAEGKAYAAGQLVTYTGATYRCVQAHTGGAGWTPDAVAALWSRVTCDGSGASNGGGGGGSNSGASSGTCGGGNGGNGGGATGSSSGGAPGGSSSGSGGGAFQQSHSTWY